MWTTTVLALAAFTASVALAQDELSRQVRSSFIYTTYGDRTPMAWDTDPVLTPLGAQQLYRAGENFRNRYVIVSDSSDDSSNIISRISPYQIPASQLTVLSRDEQYISAGASAFMQGLYPPLEGSSNYTFISGQSALANGSNIIAPLAGYQYPRLQIPSDNDLNHVWLDGSANCPWYTKSGASYYSSEVYEIMNNETAEFYLSLFPDILEGYFEASQIGYFDAWTIYDFVQYAYDHNQSVAENLSEADLLRARILATDWVMAMNANTSSSGADANDQVGVIAGKTLASRVLQAFSSSINSAGDRDKMTLLFGSFEPIIAFSALAGLHNEQNAAFLNLPPPGSSIVFELFSLQSNSTVSYPPLDDLYVEFFYQNGTDPDSTLVAYPLFSRSPSQTVMALSDFTSSLSLFSVGSIADWCNTCDSYSIFCPAFADGLANSGSGSSRHRNNSSGLSPAVAGVIGAIVALVVAALLFALLCLLAGFRVHRVRRGRRSELGGFKGAEKLASDQDLTLPKGGAGATVVPSSSAESPTVAGAPPAAAGVRGHERVGSWELREQAKAEEASVGGAGGIASLPRAVARRPSYEEDDDVLNVSPYAKGVKADERV